LEDKTSSEVKAYELGTIEISREKEELRIGEIKFDLNVGIHSNFK
jgi:hypothetical protein